MGLIRFNRGLAGAAALLGIAFYAVLLPWHIVSQASIALGDPAPAISAEHHPCHDHDETAAADDTAKGARPASKTHCPICTGFGVLHLAVASVAIAFLAPPDRLAVILDSTEDHLADVLVQSPQSRAPPRLTA
jgi:hypothetical protein